MRKALLLTAFSIFLFTDAFKSQTLMQLPSQAATYCCNTRGYYFQAPVDFLIVGLRVPTTASTANQSVAVLRFNSGAPLAYPTTTNNFTTLALFQNIAGNNVLPVSIPIYQGDWIAVMGSRGGTNSYGQANWSTQILGENLTLSRMGMQYNLQTTNPQNIWSENAYQISRIEMYYSTLIVDEFPWCQGFEDDDGNFNVAGILPTWEHGEPNNTNISSAASGDKCWVTDLNGDYNNDELSSVQSVEFDLTALVDPMVRFQVNHDIETTDDGATFQLSADSGFTWTTLGSASSPSPWYNSSTISSFNSLNSSHGWTGSSSGWSDMRHSLLSYVADTSVFFRYVISADGAVTEEGFAFDDIIIGESNDISLTSLFYADSVCGTSSSTILASICNVSIEEKTGFSMVIDTNGTSATINYSDTLAICGCDTIELIDMNTAAGGTWNVTAYVNNTGDVNSANDSIITTKTAWAIPGGSITGGGNYCEGDIAQLTFNLTGATPWNLQYSNGTTPTYVAGVTTPFTANVTQSGTYTITYLQDSTGCPTDSGSISGSATVVFNPAPVVDLGPYSTVCGDYLLDAGSGFALYDWSTGASTQTLTVTTPGIYSVTVTDGFGCEGSDEVDLEVNPNPIVGIVDTVLCEGGTFLFNAGGGYQSYLWHDGSTGQVFQVSGLTTVSVTVTDFNDCEGVGTASITAVVPTPDPNVKGGSGLAPVTMKAPAGYSAYLWNTGATTQTIDVYVSGTYTCTVTDASGCEGEDDAKAKIWPLNVDEIASENGFAVYPNPASDQLTLVFSDAFVAPESIQLLSMDGKLVQSIVPNGSSEQLFTIGELVSAGQYIIRISKDGLIKEEMLSVVK